MSVLSNEVFALEEKYMSLNKKYEELLETVKEKEKTILELRGLLQLENFKNYLFSKLILNHTEIKIPEILDFKEDGLHINNFEGGKIPIFVHDFFGESKQYNIKPKKEKKSNNFKSVKKSELASEDPALQEEKIRQEEEKIKELASENNFNISKNETLDNIEKLFEKISKARIGGIEKISESIKETTNKLLGVFNLEEYTKIIKSNIGRQTDILVKKKYDTKKIQEIIMKSLSPLDSRLVFYKKYYDTQLSIDDVQRLKKAMEYNTEHPKRYIPFSVSDICREICNYCLCVSAVKPICKRVFINSYGFPNLVYLHREKSDEKDPYSFYVLEKVSDGKRFWKMECRLDELSRTLGEQIRNYCIGMFRKIYFDVFSDNVYRENYTEKSCATKTDCEQLIDNIIFLSRGKYFCNYLRKIISKYNVIKPGSLDKFNIMSDDILIKKNFINDIDNKDEHLILKRLFDDITDDNCEKIWNIKLN